MSDKKERNHYDLEEMGNIKNAKIVWTTYRHNVLTEMFTFTEKSAVLYKKPPKPSSHLLLIFCR